MPKAFKMFSTAALNCANDDALPLFFQDSALSFPHNHNASLRFSLYPFSVLRYSFPISNNRRSVARCFSFNEMLSIPPNNNVLRMCDKSLLNGFNNETLFTPSAASNASAYLLFVSDMFMISV